ncbi:MAG: NeuD/PglB/VioB family sugar acetyltransferase [Mycobacterium sp.]
MSRFAFYSAGGYARETIMEFVLSISRAAQYAPRFYFIDDDPRQRSMVIHGAEVISYDDAKSIADLRINVAFADPELRRTKVAQCEADGFSMFDCQSPTAHIGPNVSIDAGFILSHLSTITCDARIGKAFHCNIYSYVAHDCVVGDFVTLAPRVCINGRVTIGDGAYIGTGAIVLPGVKIGCKSVVGAGAVVVKDVPDGATVVGMPAKAR